MAPVFSEPLLLIGYGNTLRGDDGVGPKLVEGIAALNLPGVRTLSCELLLPELAEPISRANTVIFVDAALDNPRRVRFRKLVPAASSRLMTHTAEPRALLALARDVFGHAPSAWWLTIPIENTALGEDLSQFAQRGLATALEEIKKLAATARKAIPGQHQTKSVQSGKSAVKLTARWARGTSKR